uniref:Uncharacterized protein n=1 Tax=Anguilla anguilla TaxID=7936 RepID=A0A0E9RX91_ANGAN
MSHCLPPYPLTSSKDTKEVKIGCGKLLE